MPQRIPQTSFSRFILFLTPVFVLVLSWLFPPTRMIWDRLDLTVFRTLNGLAQNHPLIGLFLSAANVKITDVYGALFMLCLLGTVIANAPKEERLMRISQCIFILFWFEIAVFLTKQVATPYLEAKGWGRHSPTLVCSDVYRLSQNIPWLKVKDYSHFSFPADHASIPFQWAAFCWFFFGWRIGIAAACSSIIFVLPRLTSGAHWATDCIVGSLSFILVVLSVALATPLGVLSYKYIDKVVVWFSKRKT